MSKKIFLLISLFVVCVVETYAQPKNCTGKMLNFKDGKPEAICFVRAPNPLDNKTKYTILYNGVEIYEVDFTYYKERDSIFIQFIDKQNSILTHESVTLMLKDSHFLICNYKPNIRPINDASHSYRILFGIDQPNQQFITLYQFEAVGGIQAQFILQYVPNDVAANHYKAVQQKMIIDSLRTIHDSSVVHLRRAMISYRDSVKKNIETKENDIKLMAATQSTSTILQEDFTKKMNRIFIGYFKNVYAFTNEAFDVDFTFNCNGYGRIIIDPAQTLSFKNGPQENWLRDSVIRNVKLEIENTVYETLTSNSQYPKLKAMFSDWFAKNLIAYNLGEDDHEALAKTQRQISDELSAYQARHISIPTLYHYTFNYSSTVKTPTWKYVNSNDGTDKFIDKSDKGKSVEITENLKNIFRDKFASQGNGKYNLKICTTYVNKDDFIGNNIQLIGKK